MSTDTLPPLPEPTQGLGVHRWAYGQADMLAFYAAGFEAGKAEQPAPLTDGQLEQLAIGAGVAEAKPGCLGRFAHAIEQTLRGEKT